jgi:phosphoribosylaminoimidazole-succinocarboxamide synthase
MSLQEPVNIDKEFLRLWFREHCDPYADETLPDAPEELVIELSRRYIFLYEKITGQTFELPDLDSNISERVQRNLDVWWQQSGLEQLDT